jgi:hypothetical protein
MARVSARALRRASREQAWEAIAELRRRPVGLIPPGVLLEIATELADFGGVPRAGKAWEAAMHAIASQHCSDEIKTRVLDLLEGLKPKRPAIEATGD